MKEDIIYNFTEGICKQCLFIIHHIQFQYLKNIFKYNNVI